MPTKKTVAKKTAPKKEAVEKAKEVVEETIVEVTTKKQTKCETCEATGLAPAGIPMQEREICPDCKGSGKV